MNDPNPTSDEDSAQKPQTVDPVISPAKPSLSSEDTSPSDSDSTHSNGESDNETENKSTPDKRLLNYAEDGCLEEVEKALDDNADIDAKTNIGETALHLASRHGHYQLAELLIKRGAKIEARDEDGWVPLYGAAIEGKADIVKLLLERGADPNAQRPDGWTPLLAALRHNFQGVIDLLIDCSDINVNPVNDEGCTPLMMASEYSSVDVVRSLLEKNADLNKRDMDGWTPLLTALRYSSEEVITTILARNPDVHIQNCDDYTPLLMACRHSTANVVQQLIDREVDVNKKSNANESELHVLVYNENKTDIRQITEKLLDYGADIWAKSVDDQTPLHFAGKFGCKEMIEPLLDKGQPIDILDCDAWTPLHLACTNGFGDVVELLLEKGADRVLKTGDTGRDALTLAVRCYADIFNNSELDAEKKTKELSAAEKAVEVLANLANGTEKTAAFRQAECENNFEDVAKAMGMSDSETKESILIWAAARHRKHYEILNRLEKPRHKLHFEPNTPLKLAAYHGRYVVVWWLLRTAPPSSKATQDRREAKEIAEKMKFRNAKTPKPGKERDGDRVGNDGRNDGLRSQTDKAGSGTDDRYFLTLDMLRDPPPVIEASDSHKLNEKLKLDSSTKDEIEKYDATIVDFYNSNGRVDILRRSRKMWNVIYKGASTEKGREKDGGADQIMQQARQTLGKISEEAAKEKQYLPEDLRMRWIHLPLNNLRFMEDLALRLYQDKKKGEDDYIPMRDFMRSSWTEMPTGAFGSKFMKPVCMKESVSKIKKRSMQDKTTQTLPNPPHGEGEEDTAGPEGAKQQEKAKEVITEPEQIEFQTVTYQRTALYMPYLVFLKRDRSDSQVGETTDDSEQQARTGSGHRTRSLDQFYYHSLNGNDIKGRDENQVVTRYLIGGKNGDGVEKSRHWWPILGVDQLWLWVIDDETIITSSTCRPDGREDPVIEGIFNHLREAKSRKKGRPLPSSVDEMSKFIVSFCIDFINTVTWQGSGPDDLASPESNQKSVKSVREIFSETVNSKAVEEKNLFASFKRKMDRARKRDEKRKAPKAKKTQTKQGDSKPENGQLGAEKPSEEGNKLHDAPSKMLLHGETDENENWSSISKAADLLDEVKDIRDELTILKAILTQQDHVLADIQKSPLHPKSERRPHYMLTEVNEMIEITDTIKSSVNEILNLEQNGTSLREAFESVKQGRTLMVFTVITIVFTPMSFLSSLFALNVTSFQHDSKGELAYQPNWIFPMLFCITIAITTPLAYIAFHLEDIKRLWKSATRQALISMFESSNGYHYHIPSLDRADSVRFQQLERSYEDVLEKVKRMWEALSKFRRGSTDEQKPPVGEDNA
ncbi:uncharacterized protein KD926_007809 [Aspergillus affinis]|uniref:uncharacterized protein n=1 Tax=Aspergillus affinis TaxID=1070780 RepID=UPI0022FE1117|nr:uncharacterized protein KD926_007809 [Aspergillus affinis]KAI9040728.1 hypothetical protein KD926_007809 [Aspergillus affinis]